MRAVQVDIWSDIACPWCWIGKRRLEEATALVDFEVHVSFHAFQLNPGSPTSIDGDPDYVGRLASKYRRTRGEAGAMIDNMTRTGAEAGLTFEFGKIIPVNTFDAHRVIALAKSKGRQLQAKEHFLQAYFTEGKDVANAQVLADVGVAAGLDVDDVLAVLASDAYRDEVSHDLRKASGLQITGVPFFLVDDTFGVPGAQSAETLADVLKQAVAKSEVPLEVSGEVCTAESCN